MSFRRRLFLIIALLIVLAMSANFVVSTMAARNYFSAQLQVLAEDAATSLAFSISHAAKGDSAQIETMIGAVFDSGYYLSINYLDLNGSVMLSKTRQIEIEKVPGWFVRLLDVPLSSGSAEVQSGWMRIGEVRVVAHPGFVILQLWRAIVDLFLVSCFFMVLSYGLLGLLLNYLTRPLAALEQYANEIAQENYSASQSLPKVPEFRRLALAMNRMAERIREAFRRQASLTEDLRQELSVDPVTRLPNRSEFDSRLMSWLESEEGDAPATLCFVSLEGLEGINREFGRGQVDALLADIASLIKVYANKHRYAIIGRRSGTDFALFFPGVFEDEATSLLGCLKQEVESLPSMVSLGGKRLGVGGVFTSGRVGCSDLYSAADESLRRNLFNSSPLGVSTISAGAVTRSAGDWRPILESAVTEKNFSLAFQTIQGGIDPQYEVFCRLQNNGMSVSAAAFWPLLERFSLHHEMDKLIISRTLVYLERYPQLRLSVNLTPASVVFDEFVNWLVPHLAEVSGSILQRLTLELRESSFVHYDTLYKRVLSPLKMLGVSVGVDRFGFSSEVLSRLHQLDLSYVKLDRRFIRSVDERKEDRYYLRTLESVCRASNTQIIVEGVEREAQLAALDELGFSVYQGFYFGLPDNESEFELRMNRR